MQMTSQQEAVAHVSAVDRDGNPTSLKVAPVWASSDPSIVTVTPDPDGMSCVIGSPDPGPVGSAIVTVTAEVSGNSVSATLAVDIIAGDAVSLSITTDEPTEA